MKQQIFVAIAIFILVLIPACREEPTPVSQQPVTPERTINSTEPAVPAFTATTVPTPLATLEEAIESVETPTNIPSSTPTTMPSATPTVTPSPTPPPEIIDVDNVFRLTIKNSWGAGNLLGVRMSSDGQRLVVVYSESVKTFEVTTLNELSSINPPFTMSDQTPWAISADFSQFAIFNSSARSLMVWDLTSGDLSFTKEDSLGTELGCITSPETIVFSPDNESIGFLGHCRQLFSRSGLALLRFSDGELIVQEQGEATGFGIFSPDGRFFLAYGITGTPKSVRIWDSSTGSLVHEITNNESAGCIRTFRVQDANPWPDEMVWGNETNCIDFSPDGNLVAIGFQNGVHVWQNSQANGWEEVTRLPAGRPWFSKDGDYLWLRKDGFQTEAYQVSDFTRLAYSSNLYDPVLSPDGRQVIGVPQVQVSAQQYSPQPMKIEEIGSYETIATFAGYDRAKYSPDGEHIIIYQRPNPDVVLPILVVRASDGEIMYSLAADTTPILIPDNDILVTVSGDQIVIRDLSTGEVLTSRPGAWPELVPGAGSGLLMLDPGKINYLSIPSDEILATASLPPAPLSTYFSSSSDDLLIEYSLAGARQLERDSLTPVHSFNSEVLLSDDGGLVAVKRPESVQIRTSDGTVLFENLETGTVSQAQFSPDNTFLATSSGDVITFWDMATGEMFSELDAFGEVSKILFSPDGNHLYAIARNNSNIKSFLNWQIDSGILIEQQTFDCNDSGFFPLMLTLSANGRYLARSVDDCLVGVFDLETSTMLFSLEDFLTDVSLSPDGNLLAVVTDSGVKIWSVLDGLLLTTLVDEEVSFNNLNSFGSASFNSEGTILLVSNNGRNSIWTVSEEWTSDNLVHNRPEPQFLASDPQNASFIFEDELSNNWENGSWDATIDFTSQSNVFDGQYAINLNLESRGSFAVTHPGFDTSPYTYLEFYIFVGNRTDQNLRVYIHDTEGVYESVAILNRILEGSSSTYLEDGMSFLPNQWQRVRIPLTDLKAAGIRVGLVQILNLSDFNQDTIFIDNLRFVGATLADTVVP